MRLVRLRLTPDTVGPISRGHPWVWADGVLERAPAGTPVQLLDPRGRAVAFGLADEGPFAARVLGRHPEEIPALLAARVADSAAFRAGLMPPHTDCWRVVNGEGDGLPGLVADRYGPLIVLRIYSRCWLPWMEPLVAAFARLEGCTTVARKAGVKTVDEEVGLLTLAGPPAPEQLVVQEHGLRFLVRPHVGQKTGLFLDQREHRRIVGEVSRDREVLNLFGYTGGFSVAAAAGGALRVITVDQAPDAVADARENFRLNGLDPGAHGFEVADAFHWKPERPQGLVISDPPALSRERASDGHARTAYRDLATHTGQLVAPGGILATASCTARVSREEWERALREGLRKAGRWAWLWRSDEPVDHPTGLEHPEARYLKFGLLRRRP